MVENQLNGWKEIAAYLHKRVRTAQRYGRELGPPVRRLPPPSPDVFALITEIDEWRLKTPAGTNGDEESDDRDPAPENAADAPAQSAGPAIGPDYTVYTLDETTFLRGRSWWGDQK